MHVDEIGSMLAKRDYSIKLVAFCGDSSGAGFGRYLSGTEPSTCGAGTTGVALRFRFYTSTRRRLPTCFARPRTMGARVVTGHHSYSPYLRASAHLLFPRAFI
jgi:hypothetical protein